ncbi:MAG TPA: hypothetical protein VFO86_12890, partial [Terriglobia bacterium]|nr:hypothetical protein [Terriglobia bacterium]
MAEDIVGDGMERLQEQKKVVLVCLVHLVDLVLDEPDNQINETNLLDFRGVRLRAPTKNNERPNDQDTQPN